MPENQKSITREEFLLELDQLLGLSPGTLRGDEKLDELPNWDSMTLIGVIVMVESTNDMRITPDQVVGCSTVADLLKFAQVGDRSS